MSEIEVAVCPRCARPFPPGADYCTHCGGQLGIAETTLPYIPIPNSGRFSDAIEPAPAPRARIRPLFRAVGVAILSWVPIGWIFFGAFPHDAVAGGALATLCSLCAGVLAWIYFTLAASNSRSGTEK